MNAKRELAEILNDHLWIKRSSLEDTAQAILAKLPELGFVRLEDVEIDKTELMTKINDVCHEELEYVVYSKSDVMGWEKLVKRIAHDISSAKGMIRVKEGK